MDDTLTRFVFDSAPVRGGYVRLDQSFQDAVQVHNYPDNIARALGDLLSSVTLLASSLKWDGALVLQIQSEGAVKLLCAEAAAGLQVRAVATFDPAVSSEQSMLPLMPGARAMLTLDPKGTIQNASLYQGIVAVDPAGIAATVEGYLLNSQQVQTRVILATNATSAVGLLLQKLPGADHESLLAFDRIVTLAQTVKQDELFALKPDELLHRLFHEETIRVLPPLPVQFSCSCTTERVVGALRLMGREEVDSILVERGNIEVRCQFCNHAYTFERAALDALFSEQADVSGNQTKH